MSETARRRHASRNSVKLSKVHFEAQGEAGLKPLESGRMEWAATAEGLAKLDGLVRTDPTMLGYLRSR